MTRDKSSRPGCEATLHLKRHLAQIRRLIVEVVFVVIISKVTKLIVKNIMRFKEALNYQGHQCIADPNDIMTCGASPTKLVKHQIPIHGSVISGMM